MPHTGSQTGGFWREWGSEDRGKQRVCRKLGMEHHSSRQQGPSAGARRRRGTPPLLRISGKVPHPLSVHPMLSHLG